MPPNRFDFHYSPADIAQAQRSRFLKSNQLKLIILLWIFTTLFTAGPLVLPGLFPTLPGDSWGLVVEVMLVYVVTIGVLGLVTPLAEYYLNRFWRMPLSLQVTQKHMRLSAAGKSGGLRLLWGEIRRVEETARVFILTYGPGGKYLILPKSAFAGVPGAEAHFRDLLAHPTPPGDAADAPDSEDQEGE